MHENFFSTIFFFTIPILKDFRYFVTLRFYGDIFESSGGLGCMFQLKPLYSVLYCESARLCFATDARTHAQSYSVRY